MFDVQGRCQYQRQHIMHIWLHLEPGMCREFVVFLKSVVINRSEFNAQRYLDFFFPVCVQVPSGGERA